MEQLIARSLAVMVAWVRFLPSAKAANSNIKMVFSPSWHKVVGLKKWSQT